MRMYRGVAVCVYVCGGCVYSPETEKLTNGLIMQAACSVSCEIKERRAFFGLGWCNFLKYAWFWYRCVLISCSNFALHFTGL